MILALLVPILALLVTSTQQQVQSDPQTELKLVQILFRHGDRTPVMNYPNDPYKESTWSKYGGFGQLTQTGMKQHFEFGKFLRDRYSTFLDSIYSRAKTYVVSTDYDRTLMSAYSLLNGLYSPVEYQVWKANVSWQPIPVHTTSKESDVIFYGQACPRFKQLQKEVEKSEEYKKINKRYQPMFDVVDKNSGCLEKDGCAHMNLDDDWKVQNCLYVERTHGLELPEWAKSIYDHIFESRGWGFFFRNRSPEMARLQSGGILKDMRLNIQKKIAANSSTDQIRLYSGHDTYVAAMTKLLSITKVINQPPYASAVSLELRKEVNGDNYFVQAYLKNNTPSNPINYQNLKIHGCETLCPLDKFMQITQDLVINDYSNECLYQTESDTKLIYDEITGVEVKKFYTNVGVAISVLLLITAVLIVVAIAKRSKSVYSESYRPLDEDECLRDV